MVEKRLQEINPNITIPYWDWSYDWTDPLASPIFSPKYGLSVRPGRNGDCQYRRFFPRPHCLIRDYNPRNFTAYYPSETVDEIVKSAVNYDQIRQRIELVPHGLVHVSLGGPGGDMTQMHSANDPIFWLHHSNVDRIWWEWQNSGNRRDSRSPRRRRSSRIIIDPLTDFRGRDRNGQSITSEYILRPFTLKVSDIMNIDSLCYTYEPFSLAKNENLNNSKRFPGRDRFIPDPIPEEWIRMHEMNLKKIRDKEFLFQQLMKVQQISNNSSQVVIDDDESITILSKESEENEKINE